MQHIHISGIVGMNPIIDSEKKYLNNWNLIYLDIYIQNTNLKVVDLGDI